MEYTKSAKYDQRLVREKIMGPNPIKLAEELLFCHQIPSGATVMDLGCGMGLTSVFLAKEYGFKVYAVDLWCSPTDNKRFFDAMGLKSDQVVPLRADATALPFAEEFFDAVVSIDSYNFFGLDPEYLDRHLLPFVKRGGLLYISVPGMKRDCHDNLPPELLLSWTPEQLGYLHDAAYWTDIVKRAKGAEVLSVHEMESNEEVWSDWLACDNEYAEYARNDRKSMEAGAGKHLNFIAMVLRRK